MARALGLLNGLSRVDSFSLQFSLGLAVVHERFQYSRTLQGTAETPDVPGRNRLQHDGVSLLIYECAGPFFDIQLLPQPEGNHHPSIQSEADRLRLRGGLHGLMIAMKQSITRMTTFRSGMIPIHTSLTCY